MTARATRRQGPEESKAKDDVDKYLKDASGLDTDPRAGDRPAHRLPLRRQSSSRLQPAHALSQGLHRVHGLGRPQLARRRAYGIRAGQPAIFDRNINGWVRIEMKLPDNQQDRDMLARELLVRFQTSPNHPLRELNRPTESSERWETAQRGGRLRRLLPQAAIFSVLFLGFAAAVPSPTEARIAGLQVPDVNLKFARTAPCSPLGEHGSAAHPGAADRAHCRRSFGVNITGKSSAALAADTHCRKSRRMFPNSRTRQRVVCPRPSFAPHHRCQTQRPRQWPANGFEPVPDRGMIETFTVGRLPDG